MIHLVGHNYSTREIIQNIFSPLIGVTCSPLANDVCLRNNLTFVELLQPFSTLPNDAHFRDVTGTSISVRGLRLNICDIDWRPPQTVLARKMLNEAVTNANNDKTKTLTIGSLDLEVPTAEPWFEHWRETFLTVQFPTDHEFTRHFLSCLIVLSSGDPNILETAHKLTQHVQQMQNVTPQKLPKWFHSSDVLNSYVVLHEGSQGDLYKAQQGYELLKSTFGDNKCFLIQINSMDANVSSEIPDYWASYIRRQTKMDAHTDQSSASKTPQEAVAVITMPSLQLSLLNETTANNEYDQSILHPLSPVQEHAMEAINTKFSVSTESIASQNINPNVWGADIDVDAPRGVCLNAMDVENLRHFIQDYTVRALIPYVEHLVATLVDAITNKKGVSKSLLSATKRWFVTNKPGAGASNQNAVIYTQESVELQTRKLGDLYFMFGHYNLAFQAYHQAKRDFNADSAWQYYAGALEMAAISAFMLGTANRKTYDYMEDAIVCYLTVCKLQQFATRATLLSMLCLKTARFFGEAAKQLIRMTSEESDLRSALLLEQAAYCFLASNSPMHRKYAFQIVLSGNRYSRAGQRKHAYRCYRQAYQVFQNRGWSLAEDHIQYTLAKQAYVLKKLDEASRSFAHLLRPGSLQSTQQQINFLKEYIQTQNELVKRSPSLCLLPHALPQIQNNSIRVLLAPDSVVYNNSFIPATNIDIMSNLSDEMQWHKMEEMLVATAASNKPFVFKPSRSLYTKDNPTTECPLAVQGEPIEVAVTVTNTIRCCITLTEIVLLWKLKLDNDEILSNECLYENDGPNPTRTAVTAAIKTNSHPSVTLEDHAEYTLVFKLTPKVTGHLTIMGMVCMVSTTAEPDVCLLGSLHFETQLIKNSTKQSPQQTVVDEKLSIDIIQPVPSLSVSFSALPNDLVAGEIIPVTISLRNTGITPIENIYVACDSPRWITMVDKNAEIPLSILNSIKDLSNEKLVKDKEIRRQRIIHLLKNANGSAALKEQAGATVSMYIQAPYTKGEFTLRLLFYYELSGAVNTNLKYRLVRHNWKFQVHECLRSEVTCVISNPLINELGINIDVKNETESHLPISAELYINSMGLYCEQYRLNPNKFHLMNVMEITEGQFGDRCLKPSKSASFQCRLEQVNNAPLSTTTRAADAIKSRLSEMVIMPTKNIKDGNMPALEEIYSFLVKHETIFFHTNISSEEFNKIVETNDKHATIVINWTAQITQNAKQRVALGQHFVQLHRLYEYGACPEKFQAVLNRTYDTLPQFISDYAKMHKNGEKKEHYFDADDDLWETNDSIVGNRCLLEDESFSLTAVKA